MNRRKFLQSGAAFGAISSGGMTARSYAAVLGANDRVSLGIIGLGRRGLIVSNGFVQDPRVRIVALCDVYGEQTQNFQSKMQAHLSQPALSVRHQDLLARKDVDAVYITTPDHLHVMIASDALAAGKHVYLEKPTVHHWKDRTQLQQAAAAQWKTSAVRNAATQRRALRAGEDVSSSTPASWARSCSCAPFGTTFRGSAAMFPTHRSPPTWTGIFFLALHRKCPSSMLDIPHGVHFPITAQALLADILTHWVDVAQWMLNDAHPVSASALGGIYTTCTDTSRTPILSAPSCSTKTGI